MYIHIDSYYIHMYYSIGNDKGRDSDNDNQSASRNKSNKDDSAHHHDHDFASYALLPSAGCCNAGAHGAHMGIQCAWGSSLQDAVL